MSRALSPRAAAGSPASTLERAHAARPLHLEDLATVRGALAGEHAALDRFVERLGCVPRIVAAKNRRLGSPLDREELGDLVQDVLATVWRKLPEYRGLGALESWVHPFCVLELLNAARRRQRAPRPAAGLERAAAEAPARTAQDFEPLYRGLARLAPLQAASIELRWFQRASFEEVAARLGTPVSTAKTHYYRGMERLRALLAPLFRAEER